MAIYLVSSKLQAPSEKGIEGGNSLQDANHPRLRLVKDQVINLEIPVHQRRPVLGLPLLVLKEAHQLIKVRQLSHRLLCLDIHRLGLADANRRPRLRLPAVEPCRFAKLVQPNLVHIHGVQPRQRLDGLLPQRRPLRRAGNAGHQEVFKDAPVQKLHDVKRRANDRVVLAEVVRLGHGHVGRLERVQRAVFALDLVRRLGDELSGGLLAHHVAFAVGIRQLVCWVGLTKAEL